MHSDEGVLAEFCLPNHKNPDGQIDIAAIKPDSFAPSATLNTPIARSSSPSSGS